MFKAGYSLIPVGSFIFIILVVGFFKYLVLVPDVFQTLEVVGNIFLLPHSHSGDKGVDKAHGSYQGIRKGSHVAVSQQQMIRILCQGRCLAVGDADYLCAVFVSVSERLDRVLGNIWGSLRLS